MKFYTDTDPRTWEIYAGETPAEALAAAEHAGRDIHGATPERLKDWTKQEELLRAWEDMTEYEKVNAWNEYKDASNDLDGIIERYGSAAEYAKELYVDHEGAFHTLDKLYKSDAPYYGDFIKWGIYIEVGTADELIDEYERDELLAWARAEPAHNPRQFREVLEDFKAAEDETLEYRAENKEAATPCTE